MMSKLYVITGFLGAGKTTFLKNFIHLFSEQRIHLIINEYGKEGVDGKLLADLGGTLDEITQGSIFCSCRLDKFEEVLQSTLLEKPDIIIVEASGLSNPTNVRKIMAQTDKFPGLEYQGCICLVDAKRFHKVYETATVVKKQLCISDLILINKTDLATADEIEHVHSIIKQHHPDVRTYETSYGQIDPSWLSDIHLSKTNTEPYTLETMDLTLRSFELVITNDFTPYEFERFIEMFIENTYRIKGFVQLQEQFYLVDCTGNYFQLFPYDKTPQSFNSLVILSGNGLPAKKSIQQAISWYPEKIVSFH